MKRFYARTRNWLVPTLTVALLILQGCSNLPITLPAITEHTSGEHHHGRVIWHDLLVPDVDSAKRFYGELFGWQFESVPMYGNSHQTGSYTLILHEQRPIGGLVDTTQLRRDVNLTQWVSVFSTQDIEASVKHIEQLGGTLYASPTSVGDRGWLSVAADPQGALFGLLHTAAGDPVENEPGPGDFLWNELWTNNTERATPFYSTLFQYNHETVPLENNETYHYFSSNDRARVAVVKNPVPDLDPTWVTFIRVKDPEAIVAKVPQLGGEVLLGVQENPVGGKLAIIRDPSGAGFVIQTWEDKKLNGK